MDIIAEIGQAHEGSLGIAHSYIEALHKTGVTAIKWQVHIAESESSVYEPFRVNFSYEDNKRVDYWKRMEFAEEQWVGLKKHCEDKDMEFLASPFSNAAVDLLERIGVKRYKVGSGEVNNFLMLDKIGKTRKPILLSSGMSSFSELSDAINFLKTYKSDVSIFQCTTEYPTKPESWGLNVIGDLKRRYGLPVGFSDHSGNIYACLSAVAKGAELVEFHVVFDKKMFGPDATSSLTINEVQQLTKGIKEINRALNSPINKEENGKFKDLKLIFEKSLAINKNAIKGTIISVDMLEAKKPRGMGICASKYESIIGSKLNKDLNQWAFITEEDIDK